MIVCKNSGNDVLDDFADVKSWKLVQHTKNGYANLKYKYGDRHFWCRGYYVDTVGKNAKKIEEYEKN